MQQMRPLGLPDSPVMVQNLRVEHRGLRALSIPTWGLEPGLTAVLGLNGAGKTTLLRSLAGLVRPQSGTINGRPFATAVREWRTGYVPQLYELPAGFRVRDFLRYVAWLRGMHRNVIDGRVEAHLKLVDLQDRAEDKLSTLSGGMVQRVAILQAMLHEPDLLLLDEPTSSLDIEQRRALDATLATVRTRSRVVLTTHSVADARRLADALLILHRGRPVYAGPVGGIPRIDRRYDEPTDDDELELTILALAHGQGAGEQP
jgi:ABC-2 type transport system ATP-binding protein